MSDRVCARTLALALLGPLLAGCAILGPPPPDPREPARSELAKEAGPLESAEFPQEGPAVSRYLRLIKSLEPGYEFSGRLRFGTLPAGGYNLGVAHLEPPGPVRGTILAYHGYLSFSVYNLSALFRLAEAGWAVLAIDLPGHGFSDGEPAAIGDFRDYAAVSRDIAAWVDSQNRFRLPSPLVLFGHSAGGAAVLASLLEEGCPADAAILLAPLVRPRGYARARLGAFLLRPFIRRVRAPWEDGYLALDELPLAWFRAFVRWERGLGREKARLDLPLLLLQGEEDGFIDWAYGMNLLRSLAPQGRFVALPGEGHILLDRGEGQAACLVQILDFLGNLSLPEAY